MGEVIIHAGMPKTGSTSLQAWMETTVGDLRNGAVWFMGKPDLPWKLPVTVGVEVPLP